MKIPTNRSGWTKLVTKTKLSEDFIREHKDNPLMLWTQICLYQTLSEDFIREFQDRMFWLHICYVQTLSEEFILEFKDKVHWSSIYTKQKLSDKFIIDNIDKLHNKWFDLATKEKFILSIIEKQKNTISEDTKLLLQLQIL